MRVLWGGGFWECSLGAGLAGHGQNKSWLGRWTPVQRSVPAETVVLVQGVHSVYP